MAKPRKNSQPSEDIPFEEALNKLESIVSEMEGDELDLETLLVRYQDGTKLARSCHEKLTKAELVIKELEEADEAEPEHD
ncbi:MAG: exodeoxyribonuclease VII small subunit [Verrucomicrobiae bacterium]|nr:exodeoxyribonuclease VII small subunit [Verrucomicrobiae bacterium]